MITPKPHTRPATLHTALVQRSLVQDALRRFARNRLAMLGLGVIIIFILLALFADFITPYGLNEADFTIANLRPFTNSSHILGGDGVGRDYLTRLIYGTRTSMVVGLVVPLISFLIGVPLGALAGYRGGWLDFIALRMIEITTAVPPLLFALFLISVTGTGVGNVIFVLAVTSWVEPTRIARAQFLAARALGMSEARIVFFHILPNALSPLLVAFTFAVPLAIFAEAGLSFLGIGITEPTASWGKMVGGSVGNSIRVYYHLATFPTLLVAITMLSFSFVGDGLQEALDPGRSQ
jgi:oligopeptide transport system permease protein